MPWWKSFTAEPDFRKAGKEQGSMNGKIDLDSTAGLPVTLDPDTLTLDFGPGITTDPLTQRRIDELRPMLPDPAATGPDPLYSIYMDVRVPGLATDLHERGLAYGAVVDSPGTIGAEFVRSQGHVHSAPPGSTTPYLEIYEFWHGSGAVYLQDAARPDLTDVVLVDVRPGDKVIIPPGWVHVVINSGAEPLAFGALYALDAKLLYEDLRAMNGTAWAVLADGTFSPNPSYRNPPYPRRTQAQEYPDFGIRRQLPLLEGFTHDPARYDYVVRPEDYRDVWETVVRDLRSPSS
jgi:glucose-6-phosphate isomerase